MDNLAGLPAEASNRVVRQELTLAGVHVLETEFRKGRVPEVKSTLYGALSFNRCTVSFHRMWYYWTVHCSRSLPTSVASALNDKYGGDVRIDGFSGGQNCTGPVDHWHVDSQEGLNVLVQTLKEHWGAEI